MSTRIFCALFAVSIATLLQSCVDTPVVPTSGTETNVNGLPCEADEDCGGDLECLFPDGSVEGGTCEVVTP